MFITDFHSHILPLVDDGSKSIEESLEMLRMLACQSVKRVVATPHFYANDETVDEFLARREEAYQKLISAMDFEAPGIVLGAEVKFYNGISRLKGLDKLLIQNSNLLLLEMPMLAWSEYTVNELISIASSGNRTIVLAHVDRYLHLQKKGLISKLSANGILMQMNSEFLLSFFSKRKALSLIKNSFVQFIGSDCHSTTNRPPNIEKGLDVISKHLGKAFVEELVNFGNEMFL
ncbi:MAG: hypothetical protein PUF48_03645 [Oscillospiraceae bacterium]|nr:hypothetical protein [Oscillospiraceae bacterium]